MGIFSKKSGSVTYNYIWAPNTKTNEPIPRKLKERWKDGRKDGRTDHILQDPAGRDRGSNKEQYIKNVG